MIIIIIIKVITNSDDVRLSKKGSMAASLRGVIVLWDMLKENQKNNEEEILIILDQDLENIACASDLQAQLQNGITVFQR